MLKYKGVKLSSRGAAGLLLGLLLKGSDDAWQQLSSEEPCLTLIIE